MPERVRAIVKPELLIWARESAGFSAAEAAEKLHIDPDRIAAWEAGDDSPSIPQLRRIAELYRRPLAVFYLQRIPDDFQVIRDLRRLPGAGMRRMPPELRYEIRRASQLRALAIELAEDAGETIAPFTLAATQAENPEDIGQRVRTALGITDDEQRRWRDQDGRDALRGWRDRIEAAGVLVFQATRFTADEASGFAIAERTLPVVAVNRKDPPTRRTFSLLHEFVHLMLSVSGVSDLHTDEARPPEDQAVEIFCNQAAAAALMPRDWLQREAIVRMRGPAATTWQDGEIADLARAFSVSREALLRRLLTLGRTTSEFYRRKRGQYLAEYQAVRERQRESTADDSIRRNMPVETVSNIGRPLVRMILGNYYQDRLTLSEVAGYLGIKTKHIPKLEQVAGFR
ncbi:MAG TPA: XRE family transcriptional regulator [Stellaceae bacterium]|nr:XRE family transcriptional regulator [Stellaceae bacterium]